MQSKNYTPNGFSVLFFLDKQTISNTVLRMCLLHL